TVGAMLIPQSMGYALLAGLTPQVGLYAAVLPQVAYAAIGGSRQVGVGPTAISSLLTAAGLAKLSHGDPAVAVGLAATLAVVVGLATAAVSLLGPEGHNVSVVGEIPGRLPSVGLPTKGFDQLGDMLPTALAITLLGFVESIAIAKVFAQRNRYTIRPNRELVA